MAIRLPGFFKREFFRNVATLVSGTTFVQVVAILIYLVLARIYTPEDFGLFGLYMSIISITAILATAKYELSIMLPKEDKDAVNLLGLSVTISFTISIILLVIVLIFNNPISSLLGNEGISPWLYFVPLSTFLVGLFQSMKYYSNRNKRYKLITGANVGQSLTNSAGKVSIGPFIEGPTGLIAGTILGQALGFAIFLTRFFHLDKEKIKWIEKQRIRILAKEYNLFPRFNMFQGIINNLSGTLPIFVFNSYFNAAIAGLFTMGYTIIHRPVNLLATAFYQVLSQKIIEKRNKGLRIYPDIKKFLYRLIQLVVVPFIVVTIFAPAIFKFVLGEEWEEAGKYTQIIIPWLFMTCMAMPLSFIPDMFRKQKKAMIIDFIKLVLRIIALGTGIIYNDVYLGLVLFSLGSTFVILYSLLWYISLVRKADRSIEAEPVDLITDIDKESEIT